MTNSGGEELGETADLEQELADSRAREAALAEVLSVMSRAPIDLNSVLETVLDRAARLCDAERGSIHQVGEDAHRTMVYWGEITDDYKRLDRGSGAFRPGRATLIGRVVEDRAVVHIPDVLLDAEYDRGELQRSDAYRTMLGVPLLRDGRPIGVFVLTRRAARPFTTRQIEMVRTFADQAVIAIENANLLRTIRRQREELTRFLSPQIAELITSSDGARLLEGHRAQITVVFFDIRGFTAFAETAEPEEVLGILRTYQAAMGEIIFAHQGTLEHFAGDGGMVFFNDPVPLVGHEVRAVRMAVAMRARFEELSKDWGRRGYQLGFGVGAAVGHATLGRTGFEGRYDYGAVGTVVIVAARLASQAKAGQILISQRLHVAVEGEVVVEPVDALALKGISKPMSVVNVVRLG
jgi:class 3 adenylate cyclase